MEPQSADASQQTCKACGLPDKFNFQVPDALWASVVPESYRERVVCLPCFDEFAAGRGIRYAAAIVELCFAGRKGALVFRPTAAADL